MKNNYLEFKIGLVAVFGLIFAAVFLLVIEQSNPFQNTYIINVLFRDAQQLLKGAAVNMSGVRIGRVKNLDIINYDYGEQEELMVIVSLEIYDNYQIMKNSKIRIASSGLLGTNYIKIIVPDLSVDEERHFISPNSPELYFGESPATIEELMEKGKNTIAKVDRLLNHANDLIGDPTLKENLHTTIRNIGTAAQKAEIFFADIDQEIKNISVDITNTIAKISELISKNETNFNATLANFQRFSAEIADLSSNNKEKIGAIVQRIDKISTEIEDNGELTRSLQRIRENFVHASDNLHNISEKIHQAWQKNDLEEKIYETIDSATGAAKAITQIKKDLYSMRTSFSTQILYNDERQDYESNVYFDTVFKNRYTLRAGLENPGIDKKTVLQGGIVKNSVTLRAGLVHDEFGISLAKKISPAMELGLEAFDVNKPVHRLYSQIQLGGGSALSLKYHDFSRPEKAQFLVGIAHNF